MAHLIEDGGRSSRGDHNYARLANTILVPSDIGEIVVSTDEDTQQLSIPARHKENAPPGTQTEAAGSAVQLERQGDTPLSIGALYLIDKSKRGSTKTKYNSLVKKWRAYCSKLNISTTANTNTFANFMASEFDNKLSYSYIKGFSAPLVEYTKAVDWDIIKRLKKGMHNLRPPQPKHCVIWDINTVLTWLSVMRTADSFMLLSQRFSTLLTLLSGTG